MKNTFLICCICLIGTTLCGQKILKISVALQHESIAIPFTRLSPFHPGLEVGLTFKETIKPKSINSFTANIGVFHHKKIENAIYLNAEFSQYFNIHKNIRLGWAGGLGYLHGFYPGDSYQLDRESGTFEKATRFGKSRTTIHAGIGFQFPTNSKLEPFIRQDLMLELPHSREFAVLPHSLLKVGVTMKLGK